MMERDVINSGLNLLTAGSAIKAAFDWLLVFSKKVFTELKAQPTATVIEFNVKNGLFLFLSLALAPMVL